MSQSFWIYTDGSGVSSGNVRSGSYAAMIVGQDDKISYVAGTCCPTTNNRMEFSAIIASLVFIADNLGALTHECSVTITTDSEITAGIITGENVPKKNLDLFAQFNCVKEGFKEISVVWENRDTNPLQSQADAMCHILRTKFDDLVSRMVETEDFKSLELTRKSMDPSKQFPLLS
jgi:ribonuclease HI